MKYSQFINFLLKIIAIKNKEEKNESPTKFTAYDKNKGFFFCLFILFFVLLCFVLCSQQCRIHGPTFPQETLRGFAMSVFIWDIWTISYDHRLDQWHKVTKLLGRITKQALPLHKI